MKWPSTLVFIRHGESTYNALTKQKEESALYRSFRNRFEEDFAKAKTDNWVNPTLLQLAERVREEFHVPLSDYDTPLNEEGFRQATDTGRALALTIELPHVLYVSPYLRTRQTLDGLRRGWPELTHIKTVSEERIREQEHGLATIYNDWRLYVVFNPVQALLRKLGSDYEYRFLNGENKADVRDRVRSFFATVIREHAEERVMLISHHLTLLSLRANLERWDREQFTMTDETDKPINCGVTIYRGDATQGKDGKLILDTYNQKLY